MPTPKSQWPDGTCGPKLLCVACWHVIHPDDEGACDCGFVPDQEPKHIPVVPSSQLDGPLKALERIATPIKGQRSRIHPDKTTDAEIALAALKAAGKGK